jgi:hypothetical protein
MSAPRGRRVHDSRSAVGAKQAPAVRLPFPISASSVAFIVDVLPPYPLD